LKFVRILITHPVYMYLFFYRAYTYMIKNLYVYIKDDYLKK